MLQIAIDRVLIARLIMVRTDQIIDLLQVNVKFNELEVSLTISSGIETIFMIRSLIFL